MKNNENIQVLLVEDDEVDRIAFERHVAKKRLPYKYQVAKSIREAKIILDENNFDIALLDHKLGDGTSLDLIQRMKNMPTIIITGNGNEELVVKAMNAGAVDYIVKDTEGNYLTALPSKIDNALQRFEIERELNEYRENLEKLVSDRTQELNESNKQLIGEVEAHKKTVIDVIRTIAAIVEARDPYTAGHQIRVSKLSTTIAQKMGLSYEKVQAIQWAAMIHDLGKIQIPAEILSKPGKLSVNEFELIKTHSESGFNLINHIVFEWPLAEIILQHHEKMDGSGYPRGLKGEEIMIEARILCVADVVEAMSSHRPYRPAMGIDQALAQIKHDNDSLFDPLVVDKCVNLFKDGFSFED